MNAIIEVKGIARGAHLISIKDAKDFIGRNFGPLGIQLRTDVIQIARLAVHLARGAFSSRHCTTNPYTQHCIFPDFSASGSEADLQPKPSSTLERCAQNNANK